MQSMDLKRERLAELVIHLADCSPRAAVTAVDVALEHQGVDTDDSLEVVARAMVLLRRPVDLRDRVEVGGPQDANVGGRRSAHGAADSS